MIETGVDDDDAISGAVFTDRRKIRNVHLKAYESHITALCGDSGSGKSATLALLAGIKTPSQGTAIVNGYDIRTSIHGTFSNPF